VSDRELEREREWAKDAMCEEREREREKANQHGTNDSKQLKRSSDKGRVSGRAKRQKMKRNRSSCLLPDGTTGSFGG
jgi:hypothetical protein